MTTGHLVLRHLESEADIEAAARLLETVFDTQTAALYLATMRRFPGLERRRGLVVEDHTAPAGASAVGGAAARVVATLCRLPATWSLGGVRLPVASLGYVASHPDYRRRGLVRSLMERFDREARADGCLFGGILGIPGFYDRFGYDYASPIDKSVSLEASETLEAIEADPWRSRRAAFTTRPAELSDIEVMSRLWEAEDGQRDLYEIRSQELWEHVVGDQGPVGLGPSFVVTTGGRVAGMFATRSWPKVVTLAQIRTGERDALLEMLRWAATQALAAGWRRVVLATPVGSPHHEVALSLGGRAERPYAWQVKILDHRALLERLGPVLEQRLAGSLFRNLTSDLVLDLYDLHLVLKWRDGHLDEVAELPGQPSATTPASAAPPPPVARFPRSAFARMILGTRTVNDLILEREDVAIARPLRPLLGDLFPRLEAWMEE
jgi:predicted N-acetyltransferase YhbS